MKKNVLSILILSLILALIVGALVFLFWKSTQNEPTVNPAPTGQAADVLATIPVAEDTAYEYERVSLFGDWQDLDADGCDSRMEAYKRDMINLTFERGCLINSGLLENDPYIGGPVEYVRGRGADVDIDHIVPLEDACFHGMCADGVTYEQRVEFANDPYNLLTVNSAANRQKGAKTIEEWEALGSKINRKTGQPVQVLINDEVKCDYVAQVVGIKAKYGLSMKPGEHERIGQILTTCPGQEIPVDAGWEK